MNDGTCKPKATVNLFSETAWGDEGINMFERILQQVGIAPPLRRSLVSQATDDAIRFDARRAIKFEKSVSRTDQPVFQHGIELDAFAVLEDFGAEQRNIEIVDDIESFFENFSQA